MLEIKPLLSELIQDMLYIYDKSILFVGFMCYFNISRSSDTNLWPKQPLELASAIVGKRCKPFSWVLDGFK